MAKGFCRNRLPVMIYFHNISGMTAQLLLFLLLVNVSHAYYMADKPDIGTLTGDVQNWAMLIQNYILQLASEGIKRDFTQTLFDAANYTLEVKDGIELVTRMKEDLTDFFTSKKRAAQKIAKQVVKIYDTNLKEGWNSGYTALPKISRDVYRDSDIPSLLPDDLTFSPYFKQNVSSKWSTVKISDEVPRNSSAVIDTVVFTSKLEDVLKQNSKEDHYLRWQYFGSTVGLARLYPGREWNTNFAGFYNDYDPRTRPWYIAATSGPKDVVIILDCSMSMKGEKFSISQAVAKTVIDTLTKQDYVNVICARASHWNEVGKWHFFTTRVLSCQEEQLVQATISHRKDMIEKIYKLEPGGTSELEKGFELAFQLLESKTRTGCQSIIVFVTDGKDTDGENVRCGPGYYTRSGYVPGPICKYNWTKVWDVADQQNRRMTPQARIFSYLTVDEGEQFPGHLSCHHRGSLKKLNHGENLISQMGNYFDFLSRNARNSKGLWTAPYLDDWGLGLMVTYAMPCISHVDNSTIGVVGIDATLEDLENLLSSQQWGTVYSFLINKHGQTIFHPRLKPSTALVEDPIFIPIEQLEQKGGIPKEFTEVVAAMKAGLTGHKDVFISRTYYYAGLTGSEYSFAFSLSEADKVFRRAQQPQDLSSYGKSYFNLLVEYDSEVARRELPGVFEYLKVFYNEKKYPSLRVSYLHSSIFLAPKCHCDPNAYFYDDDLAQKTVDAHKYINGADADDGCDKGAKYNTGIRAYALITQPVELLWRVREFDGVDDVKWTYVGMRSGVFRTYPAHRSRRTYDPSKRSWFLTSASSPLKTTISTAYMDAAGVGKIITISQALFEGMIPRKPNQCAHLTPPFPSGCPCRGSSDCISGYCYVSVAPGANKEKTRCATERIEAVTSLDILYDRFHMITMRTMEASDLQKSCGSKYNCPDGEYGCQTRCYLFDGSANLITDPDFITANPLDDRKYKGVTMGKKEGEVMKDLIYKHRFFRRTESVDFQGSCGLSPYRPKVTLEGIPKNPEEQDDYYKNKGPIPKFSNEYGCITDVVKYVVNESALGISGMIMGNVSGPCMSGFYYVTALPKTNLFLLVIENWRHYKMSTFYNFNCKIAQSIVNSGAYRIINGTCDHTDSTTETLDEQGKCPLLLDIDIPCMFQTGCQHHTPWLLFICLLLFSHILLVDS
ncbi:hypothetical protein CAPTEDRAFT_215114 [Capitella teleta]|uniref:VWFA domain-containing protein n=1 Tax=Capitella teleta TaxID=283909 RepID=R7USR9_CAPTE|nr:hypothetical protein CAPTEDRAFT_215114 [Capitella teleta]|eukprot:ELU06451.1 hypothetical protein CAPTEDRAFT_215114 [Capitella teleta]